MTSKENRIFCHSVGSVSTPLENLLQPVSRAIRHVAQNLDFRGSAGILTPLWNGGP